MVASVPSMIGCFNMNNIRILLDMGYTVDVACDYTDTGVWPKERVKRFTEELNGLGVEHIQLSSSRSPLNICAHVRSYKEAVSLLKKRNYRFIHSHTPITSAIMRIAAHVTNTEIIYTAHGFHFYKGAPIKNWILFYPIEKYLSRFTNTLITITKEDYERAVRHFKAKKTCYVPGVGVDVGRFASSTEGRNRIRKELGIKEEAKVLLSVGELNENKNHRAVIDAIQGLNIIYVLVGKGELREELLKLAEAKNVDLRLMGFRTDVADFYSAADVYVLPSLREGLNVSLMEAMASGLTCCVGKIRGNVDLVNGKGGHLFNPRKSGEIRQAIINALADNKELGDYNAHTIKMFDVEAVSEKMREIYSSL